MQRTTAGESRNPVSDTLKFSQSYLGPPLSTLRQCGFLRGGLLLGYPIKSASSWSSLGGLLWGLLKCRAGNQGLNLGVHVEVTQRYFWKQVLCMGLLWRVPIGRFFEARLLFLASSVWLSGISQQYGGFQGKSCCMACLATRAA